MILTVFWAFWGGQTYWSSSVFFSKTLIQTAFPKSEEKPWVSRIYEAGHKKEKFCEMKEMIPIANEF